MQCVCIHVVMIHVVHLSTVLRNMAYFQTARGVSSYSETIWASVQFLGAAVLTVGLCEINDGSVDWAAVVRASTTSCWQSGSMARERMKPEFDAGPNRPRAGVRPSPDRSTERAEAPTRPAPPLPFPSAGQAGLRPGS